jgi:hypothetical protein
MSLSFGAFLAWPLTVDAEKFNERNQGVPLFHVALAGIGEW